MQSLCFLSLFCLLFLCSSHTNFVPSETIPILCTRACFSTVLTLLRSRSSVPRTPSLLIQHESFEACVGYFLLSLFPKPEQTELQEGLICTHLSVPSVPSGKRGRGTGSFHVLWAKKLAEAECWNSDSSPFACLVSQEPPPMGWTSHTESRSFYLRQSSLEILSQEHCRLTSPVSLVIRNLSS